jgi:Skp family chaperone for outer membrane proteins
MNKRFACALVVTLLFGLPACSHGDDSRIGLVDVARVVAHWPKFLNYQNQLNADLAVIAQSHDSESDKAQKVQTVRQRYQADQAELTNDVQAAARQVATDKHLTMVFTREYVGYGGVDITPDVEKALQIVDSK